MTLPVLGALTWAPALDHPDLLAPSALSALRAWAELDDRVASGIAVARIDPDHADTATLNDVHGLPPEASANCVLVAGRRGEVERVAACVVPATTFADVNTRVRKLLDVRKASFMTRDRAVAESGQEYGGIGPLGLPAGWRVLVDARFAEPGALALQGSGVRHSKVLMTGGLLCAAPGVEVVEGLGIDR
ncbi:YbaK/prolyl-tRNA synthetase associated region [Xylanimonas cellulosilytica DSM 15894]|uniref:YbaK/prolyl-tRNA synthetase associated region n=1 Tax=Xylanimonas cellulosilytica (strain DSM 15894 / JCM 12276 / CECT 5975 / KCTC 9989 / LMG 20990 / NBRC 107835 / XIL07) TaxID=446471 RepID=D1BRX7_XYLCX|nr:YbaK/EbsC family protein [Xylanimonas cellulosilytica]ACZ30469.1 YbaK/prolyl-tRNA synthetase associated region [Xylanimonas cellulosilytica DSM 15894]